MAEPYLSEIRIFPFTFAPRGWAFCHGQLLPISQNTALFSLMSNSYGGDGRATFALPNLTGRAPMGSGTGPGLSQRKAAQKGGSETEILTSAALPAHTHTTYSEQEISEVNDPTGNVLGVFQYGGIGNMLYAKPGAPTTEAGSPFLSSAGQGQSHPNEQPYLVVPMCIALVGQYPSPK